MYWPGKIRVNSEYFVYKFYVYNLLVMQLTTHEWCDCITKYCKDFEHPAALPKIWSAYGTAISRENIKNILPFPFALPLSHFIYPNDRATENFSKNFGKFFFKSWYLPIPIVAIRKPQWDVGIFLTTTCTLSFGAFFWENLWKHSVFSIQGKYMQGRSCTFWPVSHRRFSLQTLSTKPFNNFIEVQVRR